jgi:hypothetical protein
MSVTGAAARAHQSLPTENDKTIIRQAIETDAEAKAKLGNLNTADGVGDAPNFVPEPNRKRCRSTVSATRIGRTGSSSVTVKNVMLHNQRHHCLSFGAFARVSRAETTLRRQSAASRVFLSAKGQEREPEASDRR